MRRPSRSAGGPGASPAGRARAARVHAGREWSPEDAVAAARELGLGALRDHHWLLIAACREEAARTGHAPDAAALARLTGLDALEIVRLLPGRAEDVLARLAGLAPPR